MPQRALNQVVYWLRRVAGPLQGSDADLLQEYSRVRDGLLYSASLANPQLHYQVVVASNYAGYQLKTAFVVEPNSSCVVPMNH